MNTDRTELEKWRREARKWEKRAKHARDLLEEISEIMNDWNTND